MISRKILILGCLLNCQSVWAGCADAGRDANRTGEYDNAIKIFTACLADRSANRSLLFFGRGVSYHGKRQYDRAVQDYTSSIELDSSTAGVYLFRGMCYYSKGQYNLAAQDYRIAASQGDADAQYKLGWAYTTGEGVPKDGKESVKWFRLAADQGYADAQFSLGQLHTLGRGVPVDEKEAVRWYRLAAGQGLAHAQFQLGAMYATGKGVPEDDMEAVKWYRLAAEQGNPGAQFALGEAHYFGRGVVEDFVKAYKWWNIVAADGDEKARKNKEILKNKMTPQDISKAQELSREWVGAH